MFFHQQNNVAGGGCISPNKQNWVVCVRVCVCLQSSYQLHYLFDQFGVTSNNYFFQDNHKIHKVQDTLAEWSSSGLGWMDGWMDVFNTLFACPLWPFHPSSLFGYCLYIGSKQFLKQNLPWPVYLDHRLWIQRGILFQKKSTHSSHVQKQERIIVSWHPAPALK